MRRSGVRRENRGRSGPGPGGRARRGGRESAPPGPGSGGGAGRSRGARHREPRRGCGLMESVTPGIMIVVGGASGALHGAAVAQHLRRLAPSVSLSGMGGSRMAEAGVGLLSDVSRLAVVGVMEAGGRLPGLYRAYRGLVGQVKGRPPRAFVFIDFPELNLSLARTAKRLGVPIVYFIPPQVWAWRPGRARLIARLATRVLVAFPFEVPLYESAGARGVFVGHPPLALLT